MNSPFKLVEERLVHQGKVIALYECDFEGPDGTTFRRDVARHPGAVSVVAVAADHTVTMVRQFRAALDSDLLEIPAGKIDAEDDSPLITAQRELMEEVGLAAEHWELLISFAQSPGFCDEMNHVFLATELSSVSRRVDGIEEAQMTLHQVPLTDVPGLIESGQLIDGKSVVGLLLALRKLGV